MSTRTKSSELASEILQSTEFKELLQAKQVIDKNSDYQKKIKEINQKQAELQRAMAPDSNKVKMKADEVKKIYDNLITNADMKRYIDAERKFNQLLNETFKVINDSIEKYLK